MLSDSDLIGSCKHFQETNTEENSSSSSSNSNSASGSISSSKCGFFATTELCNAASELLSTTVWDQPDKVAIVAAKAQLQGMAGLVVAPAQAIQEKTKAQKAMNAVVADEHDSYEALVREAGY